MTTYLTKQGDTADSIAWDFYGTRDGLVVETVLSANPGLSAQGPILPDGLTITLPVIDAKASASGVKLWD